MNLDEFKEFIKGKSVILVGNSVIGLNEEKGDYIDSFDVVVRFGKGLPIKGSDKYIGTRTDVWATGELRMGLHHRVPSEAQIIFTPSTLKSSLEPSWSQMPFTKHLLAYTRPEIDRLSKEYNLPSDRRLSNGCIVSLWFANVVTDWKSLTWVNFDAFKNSFIFYSNKIGQNTSAASWHLPVLRPEFAKQSLETGCPSHCSATETRIYKDILKKENTYWKGGDLEAEHTFVEAARVAWTKERSASK